MVEGPDPELEGSTRLFRPRLLPVVAAAVVVIVGLALFPSSSPPVGESASSETRPEPFTEASFLVQPSPVEIAESFMAARNAYDVEKTMSLLADDVGTVPRPLSRDELAFAFEAEEVYGVRYEPFDCRHDSDLAWAGGDASVTCTYLMGHKLSRIEGYPPVESSFRFRIREGRMALLSFPLLDLWWSEDDYVSVEGRFFDDPSADPAEFDNFLEWLDAEHPQAVEVAYELESIQTVFVRPYGGPPLDLILTRESLDLLADYLEEYEQLVVG